MKYNRNPKKVKNHWSLMQRELARDNWNVLLAGMSADQAWLRLNGRIHRLVDKFVPERKPRNHNRAPWLNREILRAIK
jgi:hypothetical protein